MTQIFFAFSSVLGERSAAETRMQSFEVLFLEYFE